MEGIRLRDMRREMEGSNNKVKLRIEKRRKE